MDVLRQTVTVYRRTERSYEIAESAYQGDVVRLPPFDEIEFQIGPLFIAYLTSGPQGSAGGSAPSGQ